MVIKSRTGGHLLGAFRVSLVGVLLLFVFGCGTSKKQNTFFTSGSRAADQRAMQRMAKARQLSGTQGDVAPAKPDENGGTAAKAEEKQSLYERLGGEEGLGRLIEDFTGRVLEDPRVNWSREKQKSPGLLFWRRPGNSVMWQPSSTNVEQLKKHLVQFLSLATGGPTDYGGKNIKAAHENMDITNPEFDAVLGDMKASLDKLQIPNREQKDLLAILESTRPQIVTKQ